MISITQINRVEAQLPRILVILWSYVFLINTWLCLLELLSRFNSRSAVQ